MVLTQKNLVTFSRQEQILDLQSPESTRTCIIFQEIAVARPKLPQVAFGIRLFWG